MPAVQATKAPIVVTPSEARDFQAEEIARDLALMDAMESFAKSLPEWTEGRTPTVREIREMAYEDREASIP